MFSSLYQNYAGGFGNQDACESDSARGRNYPIQEVGITFNTVFFSYRFSYFSVPFDVTSKPFFGLNIHGGGFVPKMETYYFGELVHYIFVY